MGSYATADDTAAAVGGACETVVDDAVVVAVDVSMGELLCSDVDVDAGVVVERWRGSCGVMLWQSDGFDVARGP